MTSNRLPHLNRSFCFEILLFLLADVAIWREREFSQMTLRTFNFSIKKIEMIAKFQKTKKIAQLHIGVSIE